MQYDRFTITKQLSIPLDGKRSIYRGLSPRGQLYFEPSQLSSREAFAFQVGIVRHLARPFLDLALYFVNLACDFIFNAWLHLADSSTGIPIGAEGENI
jgi:hypothetical protein